MPGHPVGQPGGRGPALRLGQQLGGEVDPGDPGGGTPACAAVYTVSSDWGGGFNAEVKVTNSGTTALKSWKVTWTWSGSQKVTNMWNASYTQSGATVTATNAAHNGALAAGASATLGFGGTPGGGGVPSVSCTAT